MKSPNEFWQKLAEDARPSLTDWVAPILYHLARLMQARSTAEIGYGGGYCSIALGFHAKYFGGDHHVIDINERKKLYVAGANRRHELRMKFHCLDATNCEWNIPLDLLFVDALTDYESQVRLLFNFAAAIRKDGLIVVHDYYCSEEIRRAVDTFLDKANFQGILLPYDGKPRLHRQPGKCGMAIARKL